jgi:N-hydroxyarylamine O-acetyltransferase
VNVSAYLARIGFSGSTQASSDTLRGLHLAHMRTVPFENLDISLGREIICDERRFLHKIVDLRRAVLLRELGLSVTLLSARVSREDGSASPEFDHLALRVDLDEPWLADVGFGDSFLEPLRLKPELEQEQSSGRFRIVQVGDVMIMQRVLPGEFWKSMYRFTLTPRQLSDFAPRCEFQQTSPESHFTRQRICTLPTQDGRITLSDLKLIRTIGERREERILASEDEWRSALAELFGVQL